MRDLLRLVYIYNYSNIARPTNDSLGTSRDRRDYYDRYDRDRHDRYDRDRNKPRDVPEKRPPPPEKKEEDQLMNERLEEKELQAIRVSSCLLACIS